MLKFGWHLFLLQIFIVTNVANIYYRCSCLIHKHNCKLSVEMRADKAFS